MDAEPFNPAVFSNQPNFVLAVRGDSLIGDHICHADHIVVEPRRDVKDGQLAVVMLDTGECTLRHFHRNGDVVTLKASNPNCPDKVTTVDGCRVQGVVVGLQRAIG